MKRAFLLIIGLAVLFACGVLGIALSHNPQQEFYGSELGVSWKAIATLWGASFVAAFAVLAVLVWAMAKVAKPFGQAKRRPR